MKTNKTNSSTLSYVNFRLEQLNKRARKLNMPELRTVVVGRFVVKKDTQYGPRDFPMVEWFVDGEVPTISGWKVIARLELSSVGNIVSVAPGIETTSEEDAMMQQASNVCHHCNKKRSRKETFVLRQEGKSMIVGRSCLKDFLEADASALVKYWACIADSENLVSEGGSSRGYFMVEDMLCWASLAYRTSGKTRGIDLSCEIKGLQKNKTKPEQCDKDTATEVWHGSKLPQKTTTTCTIFG